MSSLRLSCTVFWWYSSSSSDSSQHCSPLQKKKKKNLSKYSLCWPATPGRDTYSGFIGCHTLKNTGLLSQQQYLSIRISSARGGVWYLPPLPRGGTLPVLSFCRSRACCYCVCEFTPVSARCIRQMLFSWAIHPSLVLSNPSHSSST